MTGQLFHRAAGCLLAAFLTVSCSQPAQQTPPIVASPAPQPVVSPVPSPPEQDPIADERTIMAVQRALAQLGYPVGLADGVMGPATRRAILAFQKDRGLAEDGRPTEALVMLLNRLAVQPPKINTTVVTAGDILLFGDGSKEIAKAERVVPWEQETKGGLVAIRPSTAGWPAAARAGLDWAISHALDVAGGPPIAWSSTGVEQIFEIHATPVLSSREAVLAGNAAQSCRHFELRGAQRHYPGIACRDANGEWYFLHSRIRLAHPVRRLGSQTDSGTAASVRPR
ncbi:MAG: peptidoglycan-binding protein [Rhizobiales bacterium]|nr:peptidoglycan-binding protein [Hyphomicrobiales bacterium]